MGTDNDVVIIKRKEMHLCVPTLYLQVPHGPSLPGIQRPVHHRAVRRLRNRISLLDGKRFTGYHFFSIY